MRSHFSPVISDIRAAQKLRPNFSALARTLDVTPQHVRRVFLGLSTSQRVTKAIDAEIKRRARKHLRQEVAA